MLRDADIAMYRAKTRQRGSQATFDATMRATAGQSDVDRVPAAAAPSTRAASPCTSSRIVNLADGAITGFEALIRWPSVRDGQQVLVPPAEFLPIAEETGLIVPIGRWVVEETCRQIADWRRGGDPAGRLPVSVNVSHKEFWHAGLLDHLDGTLAAAGLEPQALIAGDHRGRDHGQRPPGGGAARRRCTSAGCPCTSTTSAPATPRSRRCTGSGSTR